MTPVHVIGGGPAGMAAAFFAARSGASVRLFERNEKLGKKLYITGKGRCNVTNVAENPIAHIPRNPRFLHSALAFLSADDLRALLLTLGCPTIVERGGRVFPESQKASDVTRAFEKALLRNVDIHYHSRIIDVAPLLESGPVIVATGGASYPSTGSTGDGYRIAAAAGHTVFAARPSLVPLETKEDWPKRLAGVSLANVTLKAEVAKKVKFEELGEMLFTHFGVSGPLVLSMSSQIVEDDLAKLSIHIDMKPGLSCEQLERRLIREIESGAKKQALSLLARLVPQAMAEVIASLCGIDGRKPAAQITREERMRLVDCLKNLPIRPSCFRPLEEAIVTRGGVDVKEVDPKTMMSKLVPGLFFAGEVLDVDARTGGYNIQIAFSTGALAGVSAAGWAFRRSKYEFDDKR